MNSTVPVPVPQNISLDSMDSLFDDLERELCWEHKMIKAEAYNLEAMRKCDTKVLVKWTADDEKEGWLPGWYSATVKTYQRQSDTAEVEHYCEPGISYPVNVKESVDNGTLRLQIKTCDAMDFYEEVTEIGARILIRWEKEELRESGWRAGWYAAKIQAFDPDTDEISIIYDQEQDEVYSKCVNALISEGKVKLCKQLSAIYVYICYLQRDHRV